MQRIACREFAERQGWTVVIEKEEKGISGFKVSASKRDAIQELKDSALKGEFDVLLVFMFDRLGRIENETPFILEWFTEHGIEVWSVNEGQQKIETHSDKLMNYIRFWQASGESEKTAIRVRTRLQQMTAEGVYTGGPVPFGYVLLTGEPCEWSLAIAVYAVKTNRTEDVVTFDDEKAEVLKEIYRCLNRMDVHTEHITVKETHLETQEDGSVVPVEQDVVKTYLYIDTVPLTAEEVANLYGFDTKQREQLGELLSDRNKEMWDALLLQQ